MKIYTLTLLATLTLGISLTHADPLPISFKKGEHIVLLGNGLGERIIHYPHFETEFNSWIPGSHPY